MQFIKTSKALPIRTYKFYGPLRIFVSRPTKSCLSRVKLLSEVVCYMDYLWGLHIIMCLIRLSTIRNENNARWYDTESQWYSVNHLINGTIYEIFSYFVKFISSLTIDITLVLVFPITNISFADDEPKWPRGKKCAARPAKECRLEARSPCAGKLLNMVQF